jgi:DNA-binding CsgD family transcriptional regulator
MEEFPPLPPPEAHPLTARELQIATLNAHGIGLTAIERCINLAGFVVQRHVVNAYRKMSASVKSQPTVTHRREMRAWFAECGLLPDQDDLEALLDRALSALETDYPDSASLPPVRRDSLERHLAEERALLAEARRSMRETCAQAD